MKLATGKVVDGKIVIDGLPLEEGTVVIVLTRDENEMFELLPEQEAALLLAIAEANRGETIAAEDVLQRLPRRRA